MIVHADESSFINTQAFRPLGTTMTALTGNGLERTFLDVGVLGILLVGAAVILVRTTWKKKRRDERVAEPAVDTAELRRKRIAMLGSQV